jgi:hypothetical protein
VHVLGHRHDLFDFDGIRSTEPSHDLIDQELRRRRAGSDPDRLDAVEPGRIDLGEVVDQVGARARQLRLLDETIRLAGRPEECT